MAVSFHPAFYISPAPVKLHPIFSSTFFLKVKQYIYRLYIADNIIVKYIFDLYVSFHPIPTFRFLDFVYYEIIYIYTLNGIQQNIFRITRSSETAIV